MSENDRHKTILERIAVGDRTAITACIDNYGGWIWRLAVQKNYSRAAAEDFVLDVFADIWKYADRFDSTKQAETYFILLLVHRRSIKTHYQEIKNAVILETLEPQC